VFWGINSLAIKLVMFDLDGTLGIFNHKERLDVYLLKSYSKKLSEAFSKEPAYVAKVLLDVVADIKKNPPMKLTVADAMLNRISRALGVKRGELEIVTNEFYNNEFDELKKFYKPASGARKVVSEIFGMGLKVAIATDPIVRRIGVMKRLMWANVHDFPYCFISSADDNRAAKPHPYFYLEVLRKCNTDTSEAVMIGDRMDNDIIPARKVGIKTIYIKRVKNESIANADYVINALEEVLKIINDVISNTR